MDTTTQGPVSVRAPAARRRLLAIIVLAAATLLLAAVLLGRVAGTPDQDVRPASRDAAATIGVDDLPVIGAHRSEPLPAADPVPVTVGSHPSAGPHPAGIDPKRG